MTTEQKLLAACVDYRAKLDKLEAENAALRKDKERLDWIDVDPIDHLSKIEFYWCNHSSISKIRANIDAARGEAKP